MNKKDFAEYLYTEPKLALLAIKSGTFDKNLRVYDLPILSIAVETGNFELAKVLIEKGADVNAYAGRGSNLYRGMAPIHLARDPQMVKLLVDAKADVNAPYKHVDRAIAMRGETALHTAVVTSRPGSLAVAEALIEAGADQTIPFGKEYKYGRDSRISVNDHIIRKTATLAERLEDMRSADKSYIKQLDNRPSSQRDEFEITELPEMHIRPSERPVGVPMVKNEYDRALTKLGDPASAKIQLPDPVGDYNGNIIQFSDTHIVQQTGKNTAIAHDVSRLANGKELLTAAAAGRVQGKAYHIQYQGREGVATQLQIQAVREKPTPISPQPVQSQSIKR